MRAVDTPTVDTVCQCYFVILGGKKSINQSSLFFTVLLVDFMVPEIHSDKEPLKLFTFVTFYNK